MEKRYAINYDTLIDKRNTHVLLYDHVNYIKCMYSHYTLLVKSLRDIRSHALIDRRPNYAARSFFSLQMPLSPSRQHYPRDALSHVETALQIHHSIYSLTLLTPSMPYHSFPSALESVVVPPYSYPPFPSEVPEAVTAPTHLD